MVAIEDLSSQRFYHGTRADLKPGDLPETIQAMQDSITGVEPTDD